MVANPEFIKCPRCLNAYRPGQDAAACPHDAVVHKLGVVAKPTAAEDIKVEVIRLLEEKLAEAREGKISEVLILNRYVAGADPDGNDWGMLATPSLHLTEWIGHLEQTQFDWMMERYLADHGH